MQIKLIDWVLVAAYAVLSLAIGLRFARREVLGVDAPRNNASAPMETTWTPWSAESVRSPIWGRPCLMGRLRRFSCPIIVAKRDSWSP
jgi:hypothetical protein